MDCGTRFVLGGIVGVLGIVCATPMALAEAAGRAKALQIDNDGTSLTVRRGEEVLLRYRYGGDLFKPYVSELRLPDGKNILRDSPHDHLHHHALMFAWNVDGVEFWGEAGPVGRQVHRAFSQTRCDPDTGQACITETLDWVSEDGKTVLLREERKIRVYAAAGPADRLIEWQATFTGSDPKRDVTITGRKYFGLGVRFKAPMDKGSRFLTADGLTDVKRVDGSRSRWCAISGSVAADTPIALAFMDDPKNPRHPAKWFAMDRAFAYLSATIGLEGHPFVLKAGQRVVVRYGVAVWAGQIKADRVERAYQAWQKRRGAD